MNYWLVKSEPSCFSIEDLILAPEQTTAWDGVRNYQARHFLRTMQMGDGVLFYHSNCKTPGIVGLATVVKTSYPDDTAWDLNHDHYDPKSLPSNPRWYMVDIKFEKKFAHCLALRDLYPYPELKDLALIKKGNRLSVMPVSKPAWDFILSLETQL